MSLPQPAAGPGVTAVAAPPDLLALHRLDPRRYPVLLESCAAPAAAGSATARFDLLLAAPGTRLTLAPGGTLHLDGRPLPGAGFLDALDRLWAGARRPAPPGAAALPFAGGWFLFLGYELAAEAEPGLCLPPAPGGLPVAEAVRVHGAIVRDRLTGETWLVDDGLAPEERVAILADLERAVPPDDPPPPAAAWDEAPARDYLRAVERIRRYIRDGDVFQVNLARPWRARLPGLDHAAVCALYRRLRRANPAPFAALARLSSGTVLSSSPERLVRVRGDRVETRPIAGTRPRGRDAASDGALGRELLAHPKERAEHVMLIDLERNDLGRLCVPGTVEVNEFMTLESYAHVHHIVSNVRGRLRAGVTPAQVIRAVFPGGTITGCPKVRCMEIIAELEGEGRGAYTGSLGYLGHDGRMDLNILIRTLVAADGMLEVRAGAGIVMDSDPGRELEETRAKARGVLRALEQA